MRNLWMIALTVALLTSLTHAQQASSAADAPQFNRELAAKGVTPPEPLNKVRADYPYDARHQHMNGLCYMRIVVDALGNPQNVRIVHCSDSAFEGSSLDAANKYRFKPAATREGKPIAVAVFMRIQFSQNLLSLIPRVKKAETKLEISAPIRYGFIPQRGGASNPGPDGVYPLTRNVTAPRVIKFYDEGYGHAAFVHEGNGGCDVLLTISMKGKATDPQVTHCERPELETPAVESLLKSQYEPGVVNGIEVPMRASIHLNYGDSPSKPK